MIAGRFCNAVGLLHSVLDIFKILNICNDAGKGKFTA